MTGYGKSQKKIDSTSNLLIEIKSVNNVFDIKFKHNLESNFDEFLIRIWYKNIFLSSLKILFLINKLF